MIKLSRRMKIAAAAAVFALIAVSGYAVEHFERDAFIMETVATDDGALYIPETEDAENNGKININSAGEADLVKLDGIGEALARRIIKYREENGAYGTIEEIMNVSGIGEKKFANIKDYIYVN